MGLYQLFYSRIPAHAAIGETVGCADKLKKPWAKGLLNAVLRNAQRDGEALLIELEHDPVVRTAHPRWLQKALKAAWPEQWEAICAANNAHPPMILRVNRRHHSRDQYLELLNTAGLEASACTFSQDGIVLAEPCDVRSLPGFAEGWISVQDEAAQLAADLLELAPGQRVLDACCAPGGKTCHLLEVQPQPERRGGRENLDRLGLDAELIAADARDTASWWDGTPFQRILLDAPCSATGVIRRHAGHQADPPAGRHRRTRDLAGELLDALWPTLQVGGMLVYATCSTLPTENTDVIEAFLARTSGARELDIAGQDGQPAAGIKQAHGRQLLAQQGGHDGFYYAKLIKIAAARE